MMGGDERQLASDWEAASASLNISHMEPHASLALGKEDATAWHPGVMSL